MRVRLLGAGTSSGVPRIGNDWGDCDPVEPRNRRTRASLLVESATTRILVDTSPDMREQLLEARVSSLDAVIWTHDHADHTHGIDDLRQLFHNSGCPVRGYAREATQAALERRFSYVFHGRDGYPPTVELAGLDKVMTIGDVKVRSLGQPHGTIESTGLRFELAGKSIGYATDFHDMTGEMRSLYRGLDVWILDALRRRPHPSHPDLGMALGWIAEFQPKSAVLMHMDQSMDYGTLAAELPIGVAPGFDGWEIEW